MHRDWTGRIIKNLKGKLRPALEAFVNSLEDGPSDGLRLAQEMMKIGELPPENISMCGTDAFAAYDLALIAKVVNIDEIDLEQLQLYAMICDLSRVLGVTLGFIEAQTREFLFQSVPEVSNLKVLQSLKNIRLADSVVKAENKASAKQKEPESTEAVTKTEDMLAELKIQNPGRKFLWERISRKSIKRKRLCGKNWKRSCMITMQ